MCEWMCKLKPKEEVTVTSNIAVYFHFSLLLQMYYVTKQMLIVFLTYIQTEMQKYDVLTGIEDKSLM